MVGNRSLASLPSCSEISLLSYHYPDQEIEEIYHFRWWTFRKHIKDTPDGTVISEFLPQVSWSGKHNTISCPASHHFREGRLLRYGVTGNKTALTMFLPSPLDGPCRGRCLWPRALRYQYPGAIYHLMACGDIGLLAQAADGGWKSMDRKSAGDGASRFVEPSGGDRRQ